MTSVVRFLAMKLRRPRWWDYLLAVLLSIGYLVLLGSTSTSGYTRDESFYFEYAQVYQNWFHRLETAPNAAARREVLSRQSVLNTWSQNFEHPPLMKTLFGYTWRVFGKKLRELGWAQAKKTVVVRELQPTEGFEKGARVTLFGPVPLDGQGRPGEAPRLGEALVSERTAGRAVLQLDESSPLADREAFTSACEARPESVLAPCRALEQRRLYLLSEIDSFRLGAWLINMWLPGLMYLFGAMALSRFSGLFAALAFALVPRHFFHAHLMCFDFPITTLMFATLFAFALSERRRGWAVATGFIWGVALLTKFNAFFLVPTLLLYWVVARRREFSVSREGGWGLALPPFPKALVWMLLLGLPMLFLLWPKLWFDPFRALSEYLAFHMHHDHYLQEYFGRVLEVPPFPREYVFAMTALTVPVLLLALFGWGLVALIRDRGVIPGRLKVFLVVNLAVPICLLATGYTPIFGGIKHWMGGMTWLMLIAGLGAERFILAVSRALAGGSSTSGPAPAPRGRLVLAGVALVVAGLALGTTAWHCFDVHPHGTSFYNELAGGHQGAASLRMHRQFWGYETRDGLPWVNAHTPPRKRVFFQNTTCSAATMYKREGLLRDDVGCTGWNIEDGVLATYEEEKSFSDLGMEIRQTFDRLSADYTLDVHGVPLISGYSRRGFAPP
jgi:hypothetical protein